MEADILQGHHLKLQNLRANLKHENEAHNDSLKFGVEQNIERQKITINRNVEKDRKFEKMQAETIKEYV
jgi:hypothetical protein